MKAPVIIIGMHRSGTSMITRALERMGLFAGIDQDPNAESWFFLKINQWIMEESAARWDNPLAMRFLLDQTEVRSRFVDYLGMLAKSPRVASYLGFRKYVAYRSLHRIPIIWGWKDPRNTFTLPLWLEVFPAAKIIHIYRNEVDVANSLRVRAKEEQRKLHGVPFGNRWKSSYYWLPRNPVTQSSVRCLWFEEGMQLAEVYRDHAHSHVLQLGNNAYELKYEDFVQKPIGYLQELAMFCGLETDSARMHDVAYFINPSRAYAHRRIH